MTTSSLFERHRANPILVPDPSVPWESLVVTNAAVIEEPGTGDVLMLYRAAGHDAEHPIVLGLARSKDGVCFQRCSSHPVIEPSESGWDAGCVEDPRLVRKRLRTSNLCEALNKQIRRRTRVAATFSHPPLT